MNKVIEAELSLSVHGGTHIVDAEYDPERQLIVHDGVCIPMIHVRWFRLVRISCEHCGAEFASTQGLAGHAASKVCRRR
jgi:hypothetical protein